MAITVKQKELMDMLFDGKCEKEALEECRLTKGLYVQWSNSVEWIAEYDYRIMCLKKQAETIIASFLPLAAIKLIGLTSCDSNDTSRKACLDVIKLGTGLEVGEEDVEDEEVLKNISRSTIKKVRELLADEKR